MYDSGAFPDLNARQVLRLIGQQRGGTEECSGTDPTQKHLATAFSKEEVAGTTFNNQVDIVSWLILEVKRSHASCSDEIPFVNDVYRLGFRNSSKQWKGHPKSQISRR